jgi:hypothetical protein
MAQCLVSSIEFLHLLDQMKWLPRILALPLFSADDSSAQLWAESPFFFCISNMILIPLLIARFERALQINPQLDAASKRRMFAMQMLRK